MGGERTATLRWTDDHCHLHHGRPTHVDHDGAAAEAVAEVVAAAAAIGVERMVTVGCDVADSVAAAEVAAAHSGRVWATAGVHPHEASQGVDGLEEVLARPEVVAVGECGLDFHYDHSPRDRQREVFAAQVALAHAHDLPLVIHTREAWADTFAILEAEGAPRRTVFHCFTGDAPEARRCLDLGAHLSISGIVTFKSADDIRRAVELAPLDRLMVETDSPFLAPVPFRGKPNLPGYVPLVGRAVAEVKGVGVDEVAAATWGTASAFYALDAM
ncbi:TatD family hydrolase [Iamia majanohamensis]|uniref:TatD family hydrolase n=1 Tax=Iamia majanohamensis TaxID=467976 RepID=A0AAE9YAR0_9ACTN|nr:TatD family hydrolase [Iamia majanohamensis]WCO65552.1 TatD family hydrolase [Iamia majanohamensis]